VRAQTYLEILFRYSAFNYYKQIMLYEQLFYWIIFLNQICRLLYSSLHTSSTQNTIKTFRSHVKQIEYLVCFYYNKKSNFTCNYRCFTIKL